MVQSINTRADLVINATSHLGLSDYGKLMIGDKGFEFYDDQNARNYIQIPWDEVDYVIASVMFGGKWIPRYAIKTKKNGTFSFSSRDPKKVLREVRKHVDPDHMVQSLGVWDVVKRGVKGIFTKKNKKK